MSKMKHKSTPSFTPTNNNNSHNPFQYCPKSKKSLNNKSINALLKRKSSDKYPSKTDDSLRQIGEMIDNSNFYSNDPKYRFNTYWNLNSPSMQTLYEEQSKKINLLKIYHWISLFISVYILSNNPFHNKIYWNIYKGLGMIASWVILITSNLSYRPVYLYVIYFLYIDLFLLSFCLFFNNSKHYDSEYHIILILNICTNIITSLSLLPCLCSWVITSVICNYHRVHNFEDLFRPVISTLLFIVINYFVIKGNMQLWVWFDSFKKSYNFYKSLWDQEGFPWFIITKKKEILYQNRESFAFIEQIHVLNHGSKNDKDFSSYWVNEKVFDYYFQRNHTQYFAYPFLKNTKHNKLNYSPRIYRKLCETEVNNLFKNCHNSNFIWYNVLVFELNWKGNDCYIMQWVPNENQNFMIKMMDIIEDSTVTISSIITDLDMCLLRINDGSIKVHGNDKTHLRIKSGKVHAIPYSALFHWQHQVYFISHMFDSWSWYLSDHLGTNITDEESNLCLKEFGDYFWEMTYIPCKLRKLELECIFKSFWNIKVNFRWFNVVIFNWIGIVCYSSGNWTSTKNKKISFVFETFKKADETERILRVTIEYYDHSPLLDFNELNDIINNKQYTAWTKKEKQILKCIPYGIKQLSLIWIKKYGTGIYFYHVDKYQKISFEMPAKIVPSSESSNKVNILKGSLKNTKVYYEEICDKIYKKAPINEKTVLMRINSARRNSGAYPVSI